MNRTDRFRFWLVILVVIAAACFAYFCRDGLNLGLDLKGGAHIVLQAKDTPENPLRDDSIDRLLAVLRNR
ncbi:MAG: protein translocase subunit SecD, partial [Synergistaceae bacterium]|nr:protein translocase subunit SecD [Synergistaceae bacterium]